MDPLLGLLVISAVAAIVGTALKGIVRPLSWALLAGAALLFGSSKVVEATNSLSQNPSLSPSSTVPLTNSAVSAPAAAQGWQSAVSALNPALSSLYNPRETGQATLPTQPSLDPNSGSNPTPVPQPQETAAPPSPPARVSSQPSSPPIVGYW